MDKVKHFLVSAGLVVGMSFFISLYLAITMTIVIGLLKELTDTQFDWWDLAADMAGILFATVIWLIL